ncbi:GNAT family N-acetyltransferase [Sporosarcina thermotolerans]|uniref:GNAT family N-acetyltransferase n=1 Tax=Sporosarcina thermotolerans TaxID=633404 RepID=A0AAW9AA28_9BACL|nr:GNAT family N-acetyltransferase [Sporosarcina thermotolerans]MDW0117049.1 GNAT family N-acetyltransferase [Sporosarcina thermotolerans]WHT47848.1 GNAT family N-acetyltransferase [Sporosarcina thermotolerans]
MEKELTLKSGQTVFIRTLQIEDLNPIMKLQRKVIATLADSSFLQPLSEEEFLNILHGNGSMIGAFHDDELIGFRAMLEPEIDGDHLGLDAGLGESKLSYVLYSEVSTVDPDYRGNGLQQILGKLLVDAIDIHRHRYVFATVAPFNIASLKDKFALGMHIVSLKEKYGNLLRYTLMKELGCKVNENRVSTVVDMSDIAKQQSLLSEGWIGVGIEQNNGSWIVKYQK